MANGSKRNKDENLGSFEAVNEQLAPVVETVVTDIVKPGPETKKPVGNLPKRVQETVDSAPKGSKIKVKAEGDFDALRAALKESNPRNLTAVWKPNLGHHSVAVG